MALALFGGASVLAVALALLGDRSGISVLALLRDGSTVALGLVGGTSVLGGTSLALALLRGGSGTSLALVVLALALALLGGRCAVALLRGGSGTSMAPAVLGERFALALALLGVALALLGRGSGTSVALVVLGEMALAVLGGRSAMILALLGERSGTSMASGLRLGTSVTLAVLGERFGTSTLCLAVPVGSLHRQVHFVPHWLCLQLSILLNFYHQLMVIAIGAQYLCSFHWLHFIHTILFFLCHLLCLFLVHWLLHFSFPTLSYGLSPPCLVPLTGSPKHIL